MTAADLVMLAVAVGLGAPMIVADVREHRLPNRLTGSAAALILVIAVISSVARLDASRLPPMLLTGLAMALGGYLCAVLAPDGFGMGDVKLLGVVGLALGHLDPEAVVVWLLALAAATALWLLLAGFVDKAADRSVRWRERHIAFGPPIVLAWWGVYAVMIIATAARSA